ncbi:MAG: Maf family protein [Rickettsiales bacterium]|nr:Maf family protein [Rickettsiales bacterium]
MKRIILASGSEIRKQLLIENNIKFEVIKPFCDEEEVKKSLVPKNLPLKQLALELAIAKAKSVSEKFPDAYVIGSDQICELDGEIISKSNNEDEAFTSLKKMNGKTHFQNNGTCILLNSKPVMEHIEIAELTMKNLSDAEIWDYIKKDNPIGCAGSYKFELNGKNLFSEVKGSREAILGFAVSKVVEFIS